MLAPKPPLLYVIVGPTCSGKSALALKLAQKEQCSIISADSRQCYQELNIGVAKPTNAELALVPHYYINSHQLLQVQTAADFATYSLNTLEQIFKNNSKAIMVGGSGLYIKAALEGLHAIPSISEEVKTKVDLFFKENELSIIQKLIQEIDPVIYKQIDIYNPARLQRFLEVYWQTGHSLNYFWQQQKNIQLPFEINYIGILIEREILYQQINNRVDLMIEQGLEKEVGDLQEFKTHRALRSIGYQEFFDYFDNKWSYHTTINKIKQHTCNYAKRQITWFKKND
ncbi:MAG: tRNA (adenosine(37)-N6)-dimethylallyltransferase MiaA, partial [Sediminibacterium sp.]|nr:tRNA (adenosine(37)-N6)-dimethylallyltransferase MiaA [Sediminibacterium sp.]